MLRLLHTCIYVNVCVRVDVHVYEHVCATVTTTSGRHSRHGRERNRNMNSVGTRTCYLIRHRSRTDIDTGIDIGTEFTPEQDSEYQEYPLMLVAMPIVRILEVLVIRVTATTRVRVIAVVCSIASVTANAIAVASTVTIVISAREAQLRAPPGGRAAADQGACWWRSARRARTSMISWGSRGPRLPPASLASVVRSLRALLCVGPLLGGWHDVGVVTECVLQSMRWGFRQFGMSRSRSLDLADIGHITDVVILVRRQSDMFVPCGFGFYGIPPGLGLSISRRHRSAKPSCLSARRADRTTSMPTPCKGTQFRDKFCPERPCSVTLRDETVAEPCRRDHFSSKSSYACHALSPTKHIEKNDRRRCAPGAWGSEARSDDLTAEAPRRPGPAGLAASRRFAQDGDGRRVPRPWTRASSLLVESVGL